MDNPREVTIYGLIDPRDNRVRYIGKTVSSTSYRLGQHIRLAKRKQQGGEHLTHKDNWILSVLRYGFDPEIVVLETVAAGDDWEAAEIRWIAQTSDLTNLTAGGDGPHGMKHSDEARSKISAALLGNTYRSGTTQSPESRAKISAAGKLRSGRLHSEESKAKMSAARTGVPGHPQSSEARRKVSEFQKDRPKSEEHKAKISAALTGVPQSLDRRQAQSASRTIYDWPDREILLRMKETMTYREIGEELGIRPGTVQGRIRRLLERGW